MNYEDLYYVCLYRLVSVNISLSHDKLTLCLYKHSVNYCIDLIEVRRYRSIVVRLGLSLLLAKLHYCKSSHLDVPSAILEVNIRSTGC